MARTPEAEAGGGGIRISRQGRHFAVHDGPNLVCLAVYRRGAREVARRLGEGAPGADWVERNRTFVRHDRRTSIEAR